MYDEVKSVLLDLMKAPHAAPPMPAGSGSSVRTFRAAPQFLNYQLFCLGIGLIVMAVIFLIIAVVLLMNEPFIGALLSVLFVLLWSIVAVAGYILIRLEYELRYYIVTDRSLRIRKGVWFILEQTLTYANVQNVQVEQGPVERIFGIATLAVETAGGGGSSQGQGGVSLTNYHRAVMSGLDNAESIRDLILGYLRKQGQISGLGDPDDAKKRRNGLSAKELSALKEILEEARLLHASLSKPPS